MIAKEESNYAGIEGKYGTADIVYAPVGAGDSGKKISIAVS